MQVTKADGQKQPYDKAKIETSLKRAGADENTINMIVQAVEPKLYDSISTDEIYELIYDQLKNEGKDNSYLYNLKRAIMRLGPSGYPFEQFVAGVLEQYDYATKVGHVVEGKCVQHEIDIIVEKKGAKSMLECKFHNHPGTKSAIKDILCTHARFQDVSEKNGFDEAWLVTNTKATSDAVDYAECNSMRVISWNYPDDLSFREMVERSGLHPITAREDLSDSKIKELINQGIVFAKDFKNGD